MDYLVQGSWQLLLIRTITEVASGAPSAIRLKQQRSRDGVPGHCLLISPLCLQGSVQLDNLKTNAPVAVLWERHKHLMPSSIYYSHSISAEGDRIVILMDAYLLFSTLNTYDQKQMVLTS